MADGFDERSLRKAASSTLVVVAGVGLRGFGLDGRFLAGVVGAEAVACGTAAAVGWASKRARIERTEREGVAASSTEGLAVGRRRSPGSNTDSDMFGDGRGIRERRA